MKKHYTATAFTSLIERFEKRILPKEEWTHEAHLAVAVWYLWHNDLQASLTLARNNISAHNAATGGVNSNTEGYHETITKAWLMVVKHFVDSNRFETPVQACNALVASEAGHIHYLRNFYSKNHIMTVLARQQWVEPDLAEII